MPLQQGLPNPRRSSIPFPFLPLSLGVGEPAHQCYCLSAILLKRVLILPELSEGIIASIYLLFELRLYLCQPSEVIAARDHAHLVVEFLQLDSLDGVKAVGKFGF
jgi:hypothetical protein